VTILGKVKAKCAVTWDDDNKRLQKMIDAAKKDIIYTCGGADGKKWFNFNRPGLEQTLMLEHVFYNWNNALHEFRANYGTELFQLSERAALERKAAAGVSDGG
jgi:hypothetical protein